MYMTSPHRRMLLLTGEDADLRQVLATAGFSQWNIVTAENSHAGALLQEANPTDLLLADECYYQHEGLDGIVWLARRQDSPILLVADVTPAVAGSAYELGVSICVPRQQALQSPELLAGALHSAVGRADSTNEKKRIQESLESCQRRMDRLVRLMYRSGAMQLEQRWYTHRHMLERLTEETARAKRHDTPLTVALGEVWCAEDNEAVITSADDLINWAAGAVCERKRRCDVAGQYGLRGFMLLMTHTDEAGAACCCNRLQKHLEQMAQSEEPRKSIQVHFGLASFSGEAASSQRLLRKAEEHLANLKRNIKMGSS